jgi:hypothetical protein
MDMYRVLVCCFAILRKETRVDLMPEQMIKLNVENCFVRLGHSNLLKIAG